MPARVPKIYDMLDTANSIEQAVTDKYGTPAGDDLGSIISKCQADGDINDFHPNYRPASLAALNSANHFILFPVPVGATPIIWHMKAKGIVIVG